MRKFLKITVIALLLCGFTACGEKKNEPIQESSINISESSIIDTTEETEESTTEQVTESTEAETTRSTTISTTTQASTKAPDINDFQQADGSGGIIFNENVEELSDDSLILAAQQLFESACKTEWDFTVGSPYEIDTTQTAKNIYGWDCYLITTSGINSLADIKADYHRIFSESYPDRIEEVFTESDGRAYCLNGARGADIFYEKSQITAVKEKYADRIIFNVENYYNGDDFGNESYVSAEDFVITIDSDGTWRVLDFRMPY